MLLVLYDFVGMHISVVFALNTPHMAFYLVTLRKDESCVAWIVYDVKEAGVCLSVFARSLTCTCLRYQAKLVLALMSIVDLDDFFGPSLLFVLTE